MATLAEVALLHALFAAVVFACLHYVVTTATRTPAVFTSHRPPRLVYTVKYKVYIPFCQAVYGAFSNVMDVTL